MPRCRIFDTVKLYVVPTPVGNLEDATFRSIRILKQVDLILAEDTRNSGKLLGHYEISTRMKSFHSFNEHKQLEGVVGELKSGAQMALISDAGMPGVSDPGFLLVRECVKEGVEVECLPGASAVFPALVSSALPLDRFVFEGFLPAKKGRKTRLQELSSERRTMVFFEAPHRLLKTLKELAEHFGAGRSACVSREISKMYEQHHRGSLADLLLEFEEREPRGEMVLVVEGSND
ncbi:MAG: Ribosomal RNA small subunit methyltransferase I [Flavobacteriia bacterium]|nr:MAG: Ribosomal RNA small subunit methyltransferase I [Flavobacteriia bacterium]